MDRGAWPCFVDGVICLVNSVSVCEEKKGERMKEKRREKKKEKMKRDRCENSVFQKNVSRPSNPPDELAHNVSKKNTFRTNYSSIFPSKVQNLAVFELFT